MNTAAALRILAADMIENAHSGHPGAPLGMAEMASVLWREVLRFNPKNPLFPNRDRFVLSNGHASALLYALLHLSGFDLSIDDLKQFRQKNSKTPGHPEYRHTPGVETTTGPLGQGFANAVGIALSERLLAKEFNRESFPIVDFYTYVFVGDGCLMEGISYEAASLAGTWGLNKLIVLWDDNGISIDGNIQGWFSENVPARFLAQGWNVIENVDGHNPMAILSALKKAKAEKNRPTFIQCKTIIGKDSGEKAATAAVHGAPLGEKGIQTLRHNLNWHHAPFDMPQEVYQTWNAVEKGQHLENAWQNLFQHYQKIHPELAWRFEQHFKKNHTPANWEHLKMEMLGNAPDKALSTRAASQKILEQLTPKMPRLIVGSADLAPSNLTYTEHCQAVGFHQAGNYIHYGVREFAMTAIANGLALSGFLPATATFLMFSDYAKNAIRMAALMNIAHIFIYTHDSIGVGEDGPTHQPIEQLAQLRLTPNVVLWRPADYFETLAAYCFAIENQTPTILALSRQNLPVLAKNVAQKDIANGAYVLKENPAAEITLIASGSELSLALQTYEKLQNENIPSRVVSMPSTHIFDKQNADFQQRILGDAPRLFIEAAHPDFWWKYLHNHAGDVVGINHFGASGKADELFQHFGFSPDAIVQKIKKILG